MLNLNIFIVMLVIVAAVFASLPLVALLKRRADKKVDCALAIERELGFINGDSIVLEGQFSSGCRVTRVFNSIVFGIGWFFGYRGLRGRLVVMSFAPSTMMLFIQSGTGFDVDGMFENRFMFDRHKVNLAVERVSRTKIWATVKIGEDKTRKLFLRLPKSCECSIEQTCSLLCRFSQSVA
ncbi:MAG: hypothetical protein FWE38_03140 [Firmicutes bacterium]|nr:hypothetical protein [Bacillota bacterium]